MQWEMTLIASSSDFGTPITGSIWKQLVHLLLQQSKFGQNNPRSSPPSEVYHRLRECGKLKCARHVKTAQNCQCEDCWAKAYQSRSRADGAVLDPETYHPFFHTRWPAQSSDLCACTAMEPGQTGVWETEGDCHFPYLNICIYTYIYIYFMFFLLIYICIRYIYIYIYIHINGPVSYHLLLQPFKVLKGGCMALPFMVLKAHFHPKQRPKGTNVEKKTKRNTWLEKKWRQIWQWISTNEKIKQENSRKLELISRRRGAITYTKISNSSIWS